jgi:CheY-like chemotaxis protein
MKKILIVEDELIVRSIYRRKFEISGYQVETAEEGASALALLNSFKPDAIQVDIMLPGMDGVEVIRQIRARADFKGVPILVISSFYRPDLAKEAWKAGATKCVSKMDCTPNLALELVEQMLSGDSVGVSPFAQLGAVSSNESIRVLPAESPWEEATQIIARKPGAAGTAAPAAAPTPPAPAHKAPSTLPSFAREQTPAPAAENEAATDAPSAPPSGPTLPRFAKPESGGTKITTRPTFAMPQAQRLPKVNPAPATPVAATTPPAPPAAPAVPSTAAAPEPAPQASEPAAPPDLTGATMLRTKSGPLMTQALPEGSGDNTAFRLEIRQEFLKRAPAIQTDLRDRVAALLKSKSTTDQLDLLRHLEGSVSSLASLSGITGFSRISHISGALDALVKDLNKKPAQMTGSVLRTIAHASDCLNMLFRDLERSPREVPQSMLILAVDDEPIARRSVALALGKANLRCISMEDPVAALGILKENPFDLIFLDAEMPNLNGFQLCGELRKLPTNKATPVIFVTSLTKFEVRAQSSLAGANDLIAKPFLMMELAVKALTYLLKPQLAGEAKGE